MSIMNHPKIEMLATSSLKPNPDNAKTHSPRQITQLATTINEFGWLVPIVCDAQAMILAGHARWLAAQKLKLAEVPVIRADHLSEMDRRAFALAENRFAEISGCWDEKKLQKELNALFDAGRSLETIGFSTADLTFRLVGEDEEEPSDTFITSDIAVSRPGDCWVFYPKGVARDAAGFAKAHRLLCANSLEVESLETVLRGQLADMVFDDPPYNVPVDGHVRGRGRGSGKPKFREFAMASGEMTAPEFTAFLRTVFRNCVRFSKDGSIHYHFQDWRHIREILDAADGIYHEFKQLVIWDKGVGGQGSFYRSQHELILIFKAGTAKHTNNFGLGDKGRYRTNVWSGYPGVNTFRKGRKEDLEAHATTKPIALVIDAIRDCSNPGDIILDVFAGSGTTLIAAHKAGRIGVGIEIDPLYVDVAVKRLAAASGLVPILDGDGRTFDEIAAVRRAEREG